MADNLPEYITTREAAEILGPTVSQERVHVWCTDGVLPSRRMPRGGREVRKDLILRIARQGWSEEEEQASLAGHHTEAAETIGAA